MTEAQIQERIGQLRIELASLGTLHDQMVKEFQEKQQAFEKQVTANQARFQQLNGAITELTRMITRKETEK